MLLYLLYRHENTTKSTLSKPYNVICVQTYDKAERKGKNIMAAYGIEIYKRVDSVTDGAGQAKKPRRVSLPDVLCALFSFLLSRGVLFGQACPFGAAYFAAAFSKEKMIFSIAGILCGCVSAGIGIHTVKYLVGVGIFTLYMFLFAKNAIVSDKRRALVMALSTFAAGLVMLFFEQFVLYSALINIIECVLLYAASALFGGVGALKNGEYKKMCIVRREELLGSVLFLGLCLSGLSDFARVGSLNFHEITSALLMLCFAYVGGAFGGLLSGAVLGLTAAIGQSEALSIIGIYAACGLAAGLVQRFGRMCIGTCFLFSAIGLGAQTNIFAFGQVGLLNFLFACVGFLLIPRVFFDTYFAFEGDLLTPLQQRSYAGRINALIAEKFDKLEKTFIGLSETVETLSVSITNKFRLSYARVVEEATDKVCGKCSMRVYCWEKEIKSTKKSLEKMEHRLKAHGHIDVLDFDEGFKKRCVHADALALATNQLYAVHRLNAVWDSQLNDTRLLLGRQYRDFAGIMQSMSDEITQKVVFEGACKTKILRALEEIGAQVTEVYLYEREDETYDTEIVFDVLDEAFSVLEIEKAVSEGMARQMRVAAIDEYTSRVRLEPQYNFVVSSSIAMLKKDGEEKSGDSYAVFNIRDNRCVLLLSDGMGSGADAAAESKLAISLMRNLLTVGFSVDAAVRLVNSALVLKAGRESFATLDMAVIDLLSGEAEFVKIGAAASYIKQKEGVTVVPGSGLPVGILPDTDAKRQSFSLRSGDCVILASDGIAEHKHKDEIHAYIDSLSQTDNESVAKGLLGFALKNSKRKHIEDATVIVAKLVENRLSDFV